MLRINSTTTRAVTAFDIVDLVFIVLNTSSTAGCRSCGTCILIYTALTVKKIRVLNRDKTKQQPRELSPVRPLFNK